MLTYTQVLTGLRAEGLEVVEVPGARGRCRCHTGPHVPRGPFVRPFDPTGDVMVHITAGGLGGRTPLQYVADIINGDPNLPNKGNLVTDPDGVVYLNGVGRANHAGGVSGRSVDLGRRQALSLDGYQDLRGGDVDGNAVWYGIENIAASAMTAAQRDASVRICATFARLTGRTGRGSIGHGEASERRSYADPNLDMGRFRRDVVARVDRENGFLMALTERQQELLYLRVARIDEAIRQGEEGVVTDGSVTRVVKANQRGIRRLLARPSPADAAPAAGLAETEDDPAVLAEEILASLPAELAGPVVDELVRRLGR
jgi:hypothetical protein